MTHEDYMRQALELARACLPDGDVPVGCVVVSPVGEVIGRGRNRREAEGCAAAHAEIEAITQACRRLGSWRLTGCVLYVTLEPCPMCAGAIINARIPTVIYGARDPKAGSLSSVVRLFELPYNHKPQVISGVLEEQCGEILRSFFRTLRRKKPQKQPCVPPAEAPQNH